MKCSKCHNLRHYQIKSPDSEENVNYGKFDDDEEMLLMTQEGVGIASKKEVLFLYSR